MATNSQVFTELYVPGLRNVIFENYTYLPKEYEAFLNVASSGRQFEEDYRLGGFGTTPVKLEGTATSYDDPVPGSKVQFYWTPRGKGFRATHEAMVDELYGVFNKMAASLGKSFRYQEDIQAATLLNNAFTAPAAGATNSGYDALSLCNTAHTLLRGGTARNRPSTDAALSVGALTSGIIDFERQVDESGDYIIIPPRKLIIAPEDLPLARELLGSAFKPGGATNDINVLSGTLDIVISHHMTVTSGTTYPWFIQADNSDHDMWFFWREKFFTDAADDFDTGDGKMKGYYRFGVGFGDWRGIWGTDAVP